MGEEDKLEFWGLSLSLKPPKTHLDHKPFFKRESQFSSIDNEHSPKMQRYNNTLMMMPWINNNINDKNKGVEQKTPPLVIDLEEAEISNKAGSPNSTLSSSAVVKRLGGFGGETEMMISDDEGGSGSGGGGGSRGGGERKKLRLTREQIVVLEQAFKEHTTLNTKQKVALAKQVNLRPRQVEVWFQNRRARTKLKQTEVECEQLRRFCETITEENKRLQNEVQELRALKVSPEQANHLPTNLTMCPSCKSVTHSSSSAASKTAPGELGRCPVGVFHRPVPLNLKKLSLTINNNRMFDSHLSRSKDHSMESIK